MDNNMDTKYKLFRLKRYLYHIYGEIEGQKRYKHFSASSGLKVLIFKYGKEIGERKYYNKLKNDKIKLTLQGYINRYGEIDGPKKYEEKNKRLSIGYDSLKNRGFSDDEISKIKNKHSEKSKQTKENFIKRHGVEDGLKKFDNYVNIKKEQTFKNCKEYWISRGFSEDESIEKISSFQIKDLKYYQNLYGKEDGKIKYLSIQKSKGKNKEELIEKYGLDRYIEIVQKRLTHNDYSSKSQLKFSKNLYENLTDDFKDFFMGAPINNSFILHLDDNDRNIINQKIIIPDIKIKNFIIEYDGEYWHKDKERDEKKDYIYTERVFVVIRINEKDYLKNNKKVINDILLKIKGVL